jgi:hypothetical protein
VWDGVEGPIHFVYSGVVDSLISVEKRVEAPGRVSARTVGDDRGEILRLARGKAPKDTEDTEVVDGPAKDDKLWLGFVPFQIAALVDRELDRSVKWHPPFISLGDGAGEANLISALALTGEGGGGLFPEVKLEWAAG